MASAEIVSVGLPFCSFKVLTGVVLLDTPSLCALGYALLALGTVDFALNVANLVSLVTRRRRASGVCLLDLVVRRLEKGDSPSDLGIALDVFLSFALVAVVVGFGVIPRIPAWALPVWNMSVVLNVLGAGIGRLLSSLQQRRHRAL
ncbi:hypothetical protein AKJ09_04360 [Labilithrix luteola]|uniref:Uncharacterized protein n=2 Tax=Labilithrix luteola TaxID=1391654 RepID=A0A0K1PWD1_9BACT|nr:hypothetical protein AKJ09_04360 [Labilithrix luteola]